METETFEDDKNLDPMMEMPEEEAPKVSSLPEALGKSPETVNLAEILSKEELKDIGGRVFRDFERDWQSSDKYRLRRASILKLFLGDLPEPVNGKKLAQAQVHYPIIATAVQRTHARIYD